MQRIFAGWRMKYITQAGGKPGSKGCLFCQLRSAGNDPETLVLKRRPNAYLMLNAYPYTSGHLMVAIHRHVGRLGDLSDELLRQPRKCQAQATK